MQIQNANDAHAYVADCRREKANVTWFNLVNYFTLGAQGQMAAAGSCRLQNPERSADHDAAAAVLRQAAQEERDAKAAQDVTDACDRWTRW